jgi:hypothetical protein
VTCGFPSQPTHTNVLNAQVVSFASSTRLSNITTSCETLLALWNLSLRIPEAQRFSRIYRWRKELIDHIFVSHALVGKIAQDHVTTDAADAVGPTPSIDDDPTKRRGAPGSDHRPVLGLIDE